MADKADDIRQEMKRGRQDIEETSAAITEKLAILGDRVQETADTVKHTFDLPYQVRQRPWLMVGGSLLVGYALGCRNGVSRTMAHMSTALLGQAPQRMASEVKNQVEDDVSSIKRAAVGALMGTLWAMAKQVLVPTSRPIEGVAGGPGADPGPLRVRDPVASSQGNAEPTRARAEGQTA